jgi:hypothetical protein
MFKRAFYLLFIFYFQVQLVYSLLIPKGMKASSFVSFSAASSQTSASKKILGLILLSGIEEENKSEETSDENNETENFEYLVQDNFFNSVKHSLLINYELSSKDNYFTDCFLKIQSPPPKLFI